MMMFRFLLFKMSSKRPQSKDALGVLETKISRTTNLEKVILLLLSVYLSNANPSKKTIGGLIIRSYEIEKKL